MPRTVAAGRIERQMQALGMSVEELAASADMSANTLRYFFRGAHQINAAYLERLCLSLDMEVAVPRDVMTGRQLDKLRQR